MNQKTITHTPVQKLSDAFSAVLAGAHGLVEINKRLRLALGWQAALGRQSCAEPSVVPDTLDACTAVNVEQRHRAMDESYQRQRRGARHDSHRSLQVLEVDMTGMACGPKAAFATTDYLAHQRHRRGRQRGRVLATSDGEMVVDRLFGGTTPRRKALRPLVQAAEDTLARDEENRPRTLWRFDAGGGSVAELSWLLDQGSQGHGKDYASPRAHQLAERVTQWVDDPRLPERPVGWGTVPPLIRVGF